MLPGNLSQRHSETDCTQIKTSEKSTPPNVRNTHSSVIKTSEDQNCQHYGRLALEANGISSPNARGTDDAEVEEGARSRRAAGRRLTGAWCGVVRCGAVWCGAVRCGAVRCGVRVGWGGVRCGVVCG